MDTVHSWKRILLQWIKKCNFLDKPFYSIEQSDIEIFFAKFKEYMNNDIQKKDLCSFLKENYSSFEPHFDDENALSSSDYIYVYSLLLHFSCVKCPDEFFQQKCQELNESTQQDIATFFKKIFELDNLSKQNLRHVIASTATSPLNNSVQLMFSDSPIKTPRKNDISPPTPRSCMLRERNKELYNLKTQLDNEIYEKGVLELELKQYQEKIIKLGQDLKKTHHELQNLRNDVISKNTESNLELKHSENQINRKLCKEITQKEREIIQQRGDIDALIEEKHILTEKLIHAEKQIKVDQRKIEELAIKTDELVSELERKESALQYLSEVKQELEQYISEIRSSSASSRPDLNVSVECLDLSRTTNVSGSINSPENLGCSVVDIQLREKENENTQLRDELAMIRLNNSKLSKHILELTNSYSTFLEDESIILSQESSDPFEIFLLFSNHIEKFVQKYNENSSALNKLKTEINNIVDNNKVLEHTKKSLEIEIKKWESKFENNIKEKLEKEKDNENLQIQLEDLKHDINVKYQKDEELTTKLKLDLENKDFIVKRLESKLIENNRQIEKLISDNMNMKIDFESIIRGLEKKNMELLENEKLKDIQLNNFDTNKKKLEDEIKCLQDQYYCIKNELEMKDALLQENNMGLCELRKVNKNLKVEFDELNTKFDYLLNEKNEVLSKSQETEKCNAVLKNMLQSNDEEAQKYLDEIRHQQYLVSILSAEKCALIDSIEFKLDPFKTTIDELEKCIEQKMLELEEKNKMLEQKLSLTENNSKIMEKQLKDISSKYDTTKDIISEQRGYLNETINELKYQLEDIFAKYHITSSINSQEENLFDATTYDLKAKNSLKSSMNILVQEFDKLHVINSEKEFKIVNLHEKMQDMSAQKKVVEDKLFALETRIVELREEFASEKQCEINKLTNEMRRLNDDIMNIENVCDHLTNENTMLQKKLCEYQTDIEKLTKEKDLIIDKNSLLERNMSHQLSVAEKLMTTESELRLQVSNMQAAVKKLELDIEVVQRLLVVKTSDAETLFEEHKQAENKITCMKKHNLELESKISALELALKNMNKKYETSNKLIEDSALEQFKLDDLKEQLLSETIEKNKANSELKLFIEQINELKADKFELNVKYRTMETLLEKFRTELDYSKIELQKLQFEETKRIGEIKIMKDAELSYENRMDSLKTELMEQKDNVSRLIKEVESIRKEKDTLREENNTFQKTLEEKNNSHKLLDSQHNMILERLKLVEKDLLAKQNLLNSEHVKSIDLENRLTKLQIENAKLKENNENNVKRMEKQALKLGETQASSLRFKKEAELAANNLELLKSSSETIQRENNKLNLECKSLKEKLSKFEKTFEQLESKLQQIEKEKNALQKEKENMETCENELKLAKSSLEKNKSNLEDKVRRLSKSLSDVNVALSRLEKDKVDLNLEIGGLNKELRECKLFLSSKSKEIEDVTHNLIEIRNTNLKLLEKNEKLQFNATEIQDENIRLKDELSKISLRLSITQEGYENTKTELGRLRLDIDKKLHEAEVKDKSHTQTKERLKELEEIMKTKQTTESEYKEKNNYLEEQLVKLSSEIRSLEEIRRQEKQISEKLNTDISILQAKLHKSRLICEENEKKWADEKEQLLLEIKSSEDRIKETRLELEGKLEKMKTKMKTLYNDEITKMKKKQEREANLMKSEIDSLKAQNDKYEENTKKLAGQIFRLNENILEYQKQNTFLQTKLKDIDAESQKINRVVSSHIPQSANHHALGSNLHMEDEEGEVFNNTYLSDLKNGKMPEVFGRGISPQELQHRNSLRPPHLKTAYFAQYDHQMGEDEIRDIPNLDDSLSTLLNTGQRKKVSGATSYKRPGPPTPSKNAGRLSFGGNGEPNREILRETLDLGNTHATLKTPAKFKLFSSRHSIKDEYNNYLAKNSRRKQILGTIQCSSTPRKSRAHFDQRRVLDQMMSSARSARENLDCYDSSDVNIPSSPTSLEFLKMNSPKYKRSKFSYVAAEIEPFDLGSHKCKSGKFKNELKSRGRRYSITLKGSMFARNSRVSKKDFREIFKNRSKMQRNANFNEYRGQVHKTFIKSSIHASSNISCSTSETIDTDDDEMRKDSLNLRNHHNLINVITNNIENSISFKKVLLKKKSQAPFEISEIMPPMYSNVNSTSNINSRTIYGASVILNRRIPNVNTTHVRKSSIYVKSNDGNGIILVTNQTITLLDLAQMWIQMNFSAKLVIFSSLTTLCIAVFICAFELIF